MSGNDLIRGEAMPMSQVETFSLRRRIEESMDIAAALNGCNLLSDGVRNRQDAFMIIMTGAELGLGPMSSLRSLHVIKGKVAMSAELMLSQMLSKGVQAEWVTSTDRVAEIRLTRPGGKPHTEEFTIEDAQRAQLLKPGGMFAKYPKAMLRARCISAATKAYAPDMMAGGGVYTPDELEIIDVESTLSDVQKDVRDDNPEAFDAAAEAEAEHKKDAATWFNGQAAVLDNLAAVGKRLKAAKPETDEERDAHLGELAALNEELTAWIRLHAADYRLHGSRRAGIPATKKAGGRLRHAAEACGVFADMRRMIDEAAAAIEADGGEE